MADILSAPTRWADQTTKPPTQNLCNKWLDTADTQAKNQTLWFVFSMILQGVFFLPIPALLLFYYNAPMIVLAITLALFFANIIAGMGGSGIRVLLSLFVASVVIHLFMLAIFIL